MNGQPHTHRLQVEDITGDKYARYKVTYGDQASSVYLDPKKAGGGRDDTRPVDVRLEEAVTRIIATHDQESLAAQARQDMINRVAGARLHLRERGSEKWGSEMTEEDLKPPEPVPFSSVIAGQGLTWTGNFL